ncbi:DUF3006 domain-containing protein [Candidatus Berkelbacteria bacterium CG_4_9_14_0_2_um_filter_42_30]|uniref:DUF3006 domain-containing protein n=6 Tax=Candidatus Berkelbacteria TaxID=1618330 RepID=A0A2M7K0W5_9BACT|nr:MAG: hypothetical protein AUJ40_02280 [Candidatus Berkelbacteria bacterium CG1_02_42_45]PIP50916.1 MAG: hypothetical protein COX11_01520 [Candidatus Berkelbacteria bacterium CG23_combo_of_CG06-09_8_20_14_all_41_73]PIR27455.1 MAG: hypothetical protein COV40_00770 [Candidatus Berkelbacteria bacterium CG11_big_fil_rev_8_21_14_0_20_42_15]PIX29902.1 MAG: DUF3006 domain-containing protein [Candidatus Berkelbacteria bacterium CG_4_8_14_3_um_filter_42_13]PIZ27634.1 MAG: DUF3006 domain-containing pro
MDKNGDIKLTFDRIEGDRAMLVDGKEEIVIAKKFLPKDAKKGDVLHLALFTDADATERQQKTARELLNEILNDGK